MQFVSLLFFYFDDISITSFIEIHLLLSVKRVIDNNQ